MLDKLVLNNQILAHKAVVQKVRVHLVNKQVHKLRKAKQLSEKHKDNKKLQVKVTKGAQVLAALKKVKSTEILRQALLNEKKPQAVITNGLSSPEEIAEALYFSHKTIEGIVTKLKTILNIDDSDKSWREEVLEPSKRRRKQMRTERKQKERQERKSRKQLEEKRNEWLEENAAELVVKEEESEIAEDPPKKQRTNSLQSSFTEEDADFVPPVVKASKKQSNGQEKKQKIKSEAPSSPPPLQEDESDQAGLEKEEEEESIQQHTVDDFFITQTGDHYRSNVVIDRKQPEAPNDGLVRKERRSMQNGQQRYPNKKHQSFDRSWNNRNDNNNRQFNRNNRNMSKSFEKPNGSPKFTAPKVEKDTPEKLHPSWAAKQKQKSIGGFQGKKIVFGEDGAGGNDSSDVPKNKVAKKQAKVEEAGDSKEKLHPSWAAKQKLKPSITEFKGQKIVFDDD